MVSPPLTSSIDWKARGFEELYTKAQWTIMGDEGRIRTRDKCLTRFCNNYGPGRYCDKCWEKWLKEEVT